MENLYTVKQFSKEQRVFTEGSLRNMIFLKEENGLAESGAILKYGKKILIDKEKFIAWFNKINNISF